MKYFSILINNASFTAMRIENSIWVIFLLISSFSGYSQDSLTYYYEQSIEAYEKGDYPDFLKFTIKADKLRGNHPTLLFNMARGYALVDNPDASIEVLERLFLMNADINIEANEEFVNIKSHESFQPLMNLKLQLLRGIKLDSIFMSIQQGDFHPEGIGYHRNKNLLYIGGVRSRSVHEINLEGEALELFGQKNDSAVYSVMGVAVDHHKNSIWICTSAMSQMNGYTSWHDGRSSVFEIDQKTGNTLTRVLIEEGSAFGDLIIDDHSQVYISDGRSNIIYRIRSGESQLEIWKNLKGEIRNLQGLVIAKKKWMYFSDYVTGIYRLNMKSKELEKIVIAKNIPWKGIDGLYYHKKNLYAMQNGTNPMRVIRYPLEKGGLFVNSYTPIMQNQPILNEPTQGFILDHRLVFLANSPWRYYDKEGNFDAEKANPTTLFEIDLRRVEN